MRDIKFRAYLKNKYIEVSEIHFWMDGNIYSVTASNGEFFRVSDDLHVVQYTGVSDIDKCEIYEGDVVDINGLSCNGVVVFESCCYKVKTVFGNYYELMSVYKDSRVVGNIHSNPEMLKLSKSNPS